MQGWSCHSSPHSLLNIQTTCYLRCRLDISHRAQDIQPPRETFALTSYRIDDTAARYYGTTSVISESMLWKVLLHVYSYLQSNFEQTRAIFVLHQISNPDNRQADEPTLQTNRHCRRKSNSSQLLCKMCVFLSRAVTATTRRAFRDCDSEEKKTWIFCCSYCFVSLFANVNKCDLPSTNLYCYLQIRLWHSWVSPASPCVSVFLLTTRRISSSDCVWETVPCSVVFMTVVGSVGARIDRSSR